MKVDPAVEAHYGSVVVDTNVLLSAALAPSGVPALLMDRLLDVGRLVFSAATFAELEGRIWRPKFDRYLPMERRRQILQLARASAVWVDISGELAQRRFSRDATDNAFIHAALAAGASRLVTGDDDLLCLDPLDALRILTPRRAVDELLAGKA
jgi:uncharacterized protein